MLNVCSLSFFTKTTLLGWYNFWYPVPAWSKFASWPALSDQKQITENNVTSTNPS